VNELSGIVLEVARVGGDVAHRWFGRQTAVDTKSDGSPVTVADRHAEEAMRSSIEVNFPGDGILGEELGEVRPKAARRWILDPIDGTASFMAGVPLWGTLVSVVENDDILAGCAVFPALGEWIVAAPDAGCWWNGARARVSSRAVLDQATVLTTEERLLAEAGRAGQWRSLAARAGRARTWGDCYGYLLVATGRAECMVDARMAMWDWSPFLPIVTEAGGVFTDWSGGQTSFFNGIVATNGELADEVRAILAASEGET
jgi:histidinol-phosphatase